MYSHVFREAKQYYCQIKKNHKIKRLIGIDNLIDSMS